MGETTVTMECGNCGIELSGEYAKCPKCSSTVRKYKVSITATVDMSSTLKGKARDSAGNRKREFASRSKRGGKSGRLAQEEISIDHTDPKETVKTHEVSEMNEAGQWEKVHGHTDKYPAKRRVPPKNQPA